MCTFTYVLFYLFYFRKYYCMLFSPYVMHNFFITDAFHVTLLN